jgi:hypothetical protein
MSHYIRSIYYAHCHVPLRYGIIFSGGDNDIIPLDILGLQYTNRDFFIHTLSSISH